MTHHKQVPFRDFTVDAGALSLIERLWSLGVRTLFSCEGGQMTVADGSTYDALAYVAMVDDRAARKVKRKVDFVEWAGYASRGVLAMYFDPGLMDSLLDTLSE